MPAPDAGDLERSQPGDTCPICEGTGVMRWQQHGTLPDGAPVVRELEHPCVNGCGGEWKHPAAERDRVVEAPDQLPERARGLADEAATIGSDFIVAAVRERFPGWGTADPTGAPGE